MPVRYETTKGSYTGLFLALLDVGVTAAPSDVTVTVATGGAAVGATSIDVDALSAAIPKNTVLEFSRAAGSPSSIIVITTADAAAAATSIDVEMYEGTEGDGLTYALAAADAATWDGLTHVVGVQSADYNENPQTEQLRAVVYGMGSGVTVDQPTITSKAPQITVTAFKQGASQLAKDLSRYANSNRRWWARYVLPDSNGPLFEQRDGLAIVRDFSVQSPSDNYMQSPFTVQFLNAPTLTFLDE